MTQLSEIVNLAKKLIAVQSVSGNTKTAVEILELVQKEIPGYTPLPFVSNDIPSLLYSNQGKEIKQFTIILNAHLDVVPGKQNQFNPVEKEGRLYGRGAFDMKGAAAVMILLFRDLSYQLSYPLGLQLTTDEELGGENGVFIHITQGIRTQFAIMGECNSNFRVTNQAKGRVVITITSKGTSSHAGYPWLGDNAIEKMYQVLKILMDAYPVPQEETQQTTVSITKIETNNTAINKIPDQCKVYLDVRFAPEDKDTIIPKLRSLLPNDVLFETELIRPPLFSSPDTLYIKSLRKITTDILGKELPLRKAHATSDGPYFSEVGGNAIEFGPIGNGAHDDNEWVDIQSLSDYYQILKTFLLQVDTKTTAKHAHTTTQLDTAVDS